MPEVNGMSTSTGRVKPWSSVFTRSHISPVVFHVRNEYWSEPTRLANEAGLPTVTSVSLFSNLYRSTPLLDGLVILISTEGWHHPLPSGVRVVGFKPFRLLCLLMNLKPQRRLK